MNIKAIFATDSNGGIGLDNRLPWPFNRKDMETFIQHTRNSVVVMGSNTWFSLPSKLTNRINIVLSTKSKEELQHNGEYPDYILSPNTVDEFRKDVNMVLEHYQLESIVVIGGKQIYEFLNPIVDTIVHSTIEGTFPCDTYLNVPDLTKDFKCIAITSNDEYKLTVTIYHRN